MKSVLKFALICSLFCIIPVLVIGFGHMTKASIILYLILSYLVPLGLKRFNKLAVNTNFPWHIGLFSYSWFGWSLFFALGNVVVPIQMNFGVWGNLIVGMLIWVFVMVLDMILILGTTSLLELLRRQTDNRKLLDTIVDLIIYALPIPLLILGDILFINVKDPMVARYISRTVFAALQLIVYAFIIETLAVMVLYLYPKVKRGEKRGPRFLRIVVTTLIWLVINGELLYANLPGWANEFILTILPVFQGNPLVYVTPAIFEVLCIAISAALGLALERALLNKTKHTEISTPSNESFNK